MNPPRALRLPRTSLGGPGVFILFAALLCALRVHALPQRLGDLDSDGQITVLDLTRLINHIQSTAGVPPAGGTGRLPIELRGYADVNGDGPSTRRTWTCWPMPSWACRS